MGVNISSKFRKFVIKTRDYFFDEEEKIQRTIHSKEIKECKEKGGYWDNIFGGEYFCKNFTVKKEENGYIEFELNYNVEGYGWIDDEVLDLAKEYVSKNQIENDSDSKIKNSYKKVGFNDCYGEKYKECLKTGKDKNKFFVLKKEQSRANDIYQIYKGDEKIFEDNMFFGSNHPINELGYIDDKLFFTYSKFEGDLSTKDGYRFFSETYFGSDLLTKKYNLSSVRKPFMYNDKLGFVGGDKDGSFIFYDGKKVTENFDDIVLYPCCMVSSLFEIDLEKGTIWFLAQRDGQDYIVYKNLNF